MAKSKNKNSFKAYIKKLNEIDVNSLLASIQSINLEDIKKIDINQLSIKVKKSPILKPALGIIGASILFGFLLLPTLQTVISNFKKSNQYKFEANSLEVSKSKLENEKAKFEKLSLLMSEINESILKKEKRIFITKLINETAIKANVEISSFIPIDSARTGKLCKLSNQSKGSRVNSRSSSRNPSKKGAFESNFYEINLISDYLNVIEFLKIIQYYDVTVIPKCLQISASKPKNIGINDNNVDTNNNLTIITPLSSSGLPMNSSYPSNELGNSRSYGQVESRLVLKIPSHSR